VLGKTPLSVEASSLRDADGGAHIMVTKEGFLPESILVPQSGLPSSTRMNFALKQMVTSKQCEQAEEALNEVARGVAETQSQITKRNLSDAERTIQNLIVRYPKVSVLHDLKGNLHYLQKDLTRALESYRRSIEIRPGNFETLRMIEKLGGIKGVPTNSSSDSGG
jgi:tetratricopeptide (TPR) repeat protein